MASIIFITGTDTGVGKTVLTALLTRFLRQQQCPALAMKPFCSGARADVEVLWDSQDRVISKKEINPFYFKLPVAPLAAARATRRRITLTDVLGRVRALAARCPVLLVEGAGGLFVPLGEGYTVADLIRRLQCPVIVVARNQLGTVNHTALTTFALETLGIREVKVVLMDQRVRDPSRRANGQLIAELTRHEVVRMPHLSPVPRAPEALNGHAKKLKKSLAQLLAIDTFTTAFRKPGVKKGRKAGQQTALKKVSKKRLPIGKVKIR